MHGAVLPTVLDVTVETQDYTHLTLKVRTASAFFLHEFYGKHRHVVFRTYARVCIYARVFAAAGKNTFAFMDYHL